MTNDSNSRLKRAFSAPEPTVWRAVGKPLLDCVGSALLLVLLSPVLIWGVILVRISSPGPVFFRQTRAGKHGWPFQVVKFRTMRGGRTPDPRELVPLDHPEITGVGRVLRRLKVDEIPQLWNVLRGEMSLVGPRPTLLDQVALYDEFRRQRLEVKPGLTGLAQVYSSAAASWEERILYDIAYVRRCSFLLDLWILVRTLWVVAVGEERARVPFGASRFARYVQAPPGFDERPPA